jgi:3-phenylpropionate/trans-cinnamate dioxygenase ferredoxin subunit
VAEVEVCPLDELPPGTVRIVQVRPLLAVGVYNCDGELLALEDRCSHDDGPLCEGDFDCGEGVVICPRHGAQFDIRTGRALTLPAYIAVETFPVSVREDGMVTVDA